VRRPAFALAVALATAALAARPGFAVEEQSRSDLEWNYDLTIKGTWTWRPVDGPLAKQGVRQVAERLLEKLSDGKTDGEGRGGRIVLSVTEAPKDLAPGFEDDVRAWQLLEERLIAIENAEDEASAQQRDSLKAQQEPLEKKISANLQALVATDEVRRLLMVRFGTDAKSWPETQEPTLEVLGKAADRDPGVPALCFDVLGDAGNLKGVTMPCKARMCVLVVRGQMHRLAMWSWRTPRDREGIWSNLTFTERSYVIPKSTARESRPGAGAAGAAAAAPVDETTDVGEEKKVGNLLVEGWEVLKPKGMKTIPIDRAKPNQPAGRWTMESGQDTGEIMLEVIRSDARDDAGNALGEPDLRGRLVRTWEQFFSQHTMGPLEAFEFARPSEKAPFLSLPPDDEKKAVKRPPPGQKKEWDWAEIERLKIAGEADNVRITREKVRNTYRMALKGELERVGTDVRCYYTFTLGVRSYVVTVVCYRGGWERFREPIDAFLRSFRLESPEK
jgi:hypothetical protein